jgi:glycosyltransferase involved in cell wall biosynthesis
VYKDTRFLRSATETLEEATNKITSNFTLLIAEDGSNSSDIVKELNQKYHNIVHIQHDQRLGRGKALRSAWNQVEGEVYVYIDVDMATDLTTFNAYANLLDRQEKFDLVTGSRYLANSQTKRPRLRRFASMAYNSLIEAIFRTGVHDHQCGFKSFSAKLIKVLSVEARSDSWFWDTEVIVLAKKFGFRICEIPVNWQEMKGRKTPLGRLARDVWVHGTGMLRLFWRVYVND